VNAVAEYGMGRAWRGAGSRTGLVGGELGGGRDWWGRVGGGFPGVSPAWPSFLSLASNRICLAAIPASPSRGITAADLARSWQVWWGAGRGRARGRGWWAASLVVGGIGKGAELAASVASPPHGLPRIPVMPGGYPGVSLAVHHCGGSRAELAGLVGARGRRVSRRRLARSWRVAGAGYRGRKCRGP
jgi:hypothetical protein